MRLRDIERDVAAVGPFGAQRVRQLLGRVVGLGEKQPTPAAIDRRVAPRRRVGRDRLAAFAPFAP